MGQTQQRENTKLLSDTNRKTTEKTIQTPESNNTMEQSQALPMLGLSLTIVRNKEGKWLAVKENRNRGWWIPGGKVDPPEDFITSAVREVKEEAGIDVIIKGILRIEQLAQPHGRQSIFRYKIIFYAEPADEKQKLKHIPDKESEEARWVTLKELIELSEKPPYLRGSELLEFGGYLENKGIIYPLSLLESVNCSSAKIQKKEEKGKPQQ